MIMMVMILLSLGILQEAGTWVPAPVYSAHILLLAFKQIGEVNSQTNFSCLLNLTNPSTL